MKTKSIDWGMIPLRNSISLKSQAALPAVGTTIAGQKSPPLSKPTHSDPTTQDFQPISTMTKSSNATFPLDSLQRSAPRSRPSLGSPILVGSSRHIDSLTYWKESGMVDRLISSMRRSSRMTRYFANMPTGLTLRTR